MAGIVFIDRMGVDMDQEPKKKSENWGCAVVIVFLVFIPMLYVLSIGPAVMIVDQYPKIISNKTAETFYFPVIWLHRHTFLSEPLDAYVKFWVHR